MKRRNAVKVLGALPILTFMLSCDPTPSAATVVTGKVTDKNGNPLAEAGLIMTGLKGSGTTSSVVFEVSVQSASDGTYSFSKLVPFNTESIEIYSKDTPSISTNDYTVYYFFDHILQREGSPFVLASSNWGKTTVLNYQFVKYDNQ